MIYVVTLLSVILFVMYNYVFIKLYQLNSYNIKSFLKNIFSFKLSLGDKNKVVFTKRMIRFVAVFAILSFAIFFVINFFLKNFWIILLDYFVVFLFSPIVICASHYSCMPVEIVIKKAYISKAKKKLKKLKVVRIGITGSYGKTSTKNILKTLLEKEYKVCATPKNFNTEMGITKTILENLDDDDVLIAEMGARKKGDIEVLAKMIKPNYGIITTIGPQHIETFKNIQTIEETKNELAKNLDENGIMIFNGDSKSTKKLYHLFQGEKYLACDEEGFAYAKNISLNNQGSRFDLIIDGKCLKCSTKLLGKCNINNIVTACALAYLMGITSQDIISAVKSLQPSPHRLEIIKNNGVVIIDDSYNSNLVGAKEALEVLSNFDGRKIVVTPGIVEMGKSQSQVNFNLGCQIADVADFIVIMNEMNKNFILSGAISHNFDRKKILFAGSRRKQKEILSLLTCEKCVILFENDLPDNYK